MKTYAVWDGLNEYREAIRQLPAACAGEAVHIVEMEVNAAYREVAAVYAAHQFTGTLLRRLRVSAIEVHGEFTTGLKLTSGSPLAWLFDNGSQARHYTGTDKRGRVFNNASRGKMWGQTPSPPTHTFSRAVGKAKRNVVFYLKEMVLRHGATSVVGDV